MATKSDKFKITLVNNQPESIKKVLEKIHKLNQLGNVLDKEVVSLEKEIGKWIV